MKLTPPDQPSLPFEMSTSPGPSFAEALEMISSWSDLTETRRSNLASGLRSAAKLAGLPLSELPCCPERLNGLLFERPPAAAGMSGRRLRDVLALVRAVLRRLGRHRPFEAGEQDLSTEWVGFMEVLPDTPRRAGLRGFTRWCSAQGMSPHQVDDETLARFVEEDRATRLAASTRDQTRSLVAAWNWATTLQPAPGRYAKVTLPSRREPYTIPFEHFPRSFQASVARFAERLSGSGHARAGLPGVPGRRFQAAILNPFRGPAKSFRPLKPATIASRLFSIRQAAAALHLTSTPLSEIRDLRDLVHPLDHAGRILDFFDERAGGKSGGQLWTIAEVLRQVGHFHVEIPEEDRAQLSAWAKAAQGRRRGEMGPKARACIQQFVDPRNRARLLHLPDQLAREAKESGLDPRAAARLARSALLIDFVITCPVRILDVQGLKVGEHFVFLDGDRRTPSHLHVPDGSSKTGEPISWPLAASTRKLLGVWLGRHRATLGPSASPYLFPGESGGALSISALRAAFQKTIADRLGLDIYPHAARHLAAFLYLRAHPGQYEVVRRILGHRSVQTTIQFYCGLETDAAAQAFDKVVAKERASTRLLALGARRKAKGAGSRRRP
jgi:integrase